MPNAPTLAAASDTGVSTSDRITSVNTPTLNFQSTDNFYRIYHNGVRIGTWDYEIGTSETLGTQPQGVQQYALGALDRAGNETKSPPLILTIDSN